MAEAGDLRFALNHMVAPQFGLADFFALATALRVRDVEIRNDIAGKPILDGTTAAAVKAAAEKAGVTIITINALQRFNKWNAHREKEAIILADFARDCGARAIILVPVNDGSGRGDGERVKNATASLRALKPILSDRGIRGLVEPLGFEVCSLRRKSEAAAAIDSVGGDFRLVHDTFHHHLAGEETTFPALTGLVHISGVDDKTVTVDAMRDPHRVLVGPGDRVGNVEQIGAIRAGGYGGPFSFEPFAEEVLTFPDPARRVRESMDFIRTRLISLAA